jgi:O-antigen/teichoic acid export membrane protein
MFYGAHSFKAIVATKLFQSAPILIAWFLPLPNVAYYTMSAKVIEYLADIIGRVGMVTAPNATELMARGERHALVDLAIMANRYSLMLFAPVVVFLLVYPYELYALWIRPDFAANSAYLVPVLLIGNTIAAGQHNSVSVLFGIGRHQVYSTCLLLEAIVTALLYAATLPRFGLMGAACASAAMMTLNRGAVACILLSRELGISASGYAASIYGRPLAVAGICWVAAWLVKTVLPGHTWPQLIAGASVIGALYLPLAFAFCLQPEHRTLAVGRARYALARFRG